MISHRIGKRTLNVLRYGQVTFIGLTLRSNSFELIADIFGFLQGQPEFKEESHLTFLII